MSSDQTELSRQDDFDVVASVPLVWLNAAEYLKISADVLFAHWENSEKEYFELLDKLRGSDESIDDSLYTEFRIMLQKLSTVNVATMLIGLAIENLLKGLIAQTGSHTVASEGRLKIGSHNLTSLANRVPLKVSQREISLLDKASKFIEWRGRYNMPMSYLKTDSNLNYERGDFEGLSELFQRIKSAID